MDKIFQQDLTKEEKVGGIFAEPAYLLLAESGESNAHEIIRLITLEAEKSGAAFFVVLQKHTEVFKRISGQLEKLGVSEPASFFAHPERYRGIAAEKARRLAQKYRTKPE